MPEQNLTLNVNGTAFGGWKNVRVTRSIETISGMFEVAVSEHWPGSRERMQIRVGDECAVAIDGQPIITGYVDEVALSYDANSHEVMVRGRDKTGDLVDCSVVSTENQFSGKMEQIAKKICDPFKVGVKATTDTGKSFDGLVLNQGESAFEVLERMARMRGVLLMSDGVGGFVIGRAGTKRIATALIRGENILAAEAAPNLRERFGKYVVKGQSMDDGLFSDYKGEAEDDWVTRYRPLIIIAEEPGDISAYKKRAEWERNVRAGRSVPVTVTVQGWYHRDALWQINERVYTRDEWLSVDGDLLIASVAFLMDENGRRTMLSLTPPEAYDRIPLPRPGEEDQWFKAQ